MSAKPQTEGQAKQDAATIAKPTTHFPKKKEGGVGAHPPTEECIGCADPTNHHISCPHYCFQEAGDPDADALFVREGEAVLARLNVEPTKSVFSDCDPVSDCLVTLVQLCT